MPTVQTAIDIDAPPERVWEVLTDFTADRGWDPFFLRLDGTPRPGETLTVTLVGTDGPGMTFRPTVLVADRPHHLSWLGRLLVPGLFDGRHEFLLDATPSGGTHLVHRERFAGVLTVFARGTIAGAGTGFAAFNRALKARVESS